MSTTAPSQLDPESVDLSGLSVATTVASDPNPRTGTVYDPVIFAAGAPVWFHPMPGGAHLMVNARSWVSATPSGGVGLFTDYEEELWPSWFVVRGITGKRDFVPGWGRFLPVNTKAISELRLIGAASRAPDYLYLLHSAVIAGQPTAHVQLIRVAPGGVNIYVEETPPSLPGVAFDKGIRYATPYLYLYGTGPGGVIYEIRKRWGDLGTTTRQSSGYQPAWEYFTGGGYSTEEGLRSRYAEEWTTHVSPLEGVTTAGPLSFGTFRHVLLMATVVPSGTDYLGRVYESRQGRPYRPTPTSVNLGASADYLGHGLQLQSQLETNPGTPAMAGASAGVPYLVSTKATVTTGPPNKRGSALVNTWGLHTIHL